MAAQIKVRGVIVNSDGEVFLCKLKKQGHFCLPGGTLEEGELVEDCLRREFIEELAIEPVIGSLLHINDFHRKGTQEVVIDIRYEILNHQDFVDVDISKASHGFEHSEVGFYDLEMIQGEYKPESLKSTIFG